MKLVFVNLSGLAFDVDTPGREPLGGTESAVAYLTRALAQRGHDIVLIANLSADMVQNQESQKSGVRHMPLDAVDADYFVANDFEAVIAVSAPHSAPLLRQFAPNACHLAWLHAMPDVEPMKQLLAMAPQIDCAVFVSDFHRAACGFPGRTHVIGNGIAPAFETLFGSAQALAATKENRAVYTSMPYRGLEILALAAPHVRGGTHFDIYSAMHTYRLGEEGFRELYARLQDSPNCTYHGAISQTSLAEAIKPAAFLAYPSTFEETFCISAAEAIAAGLRVIATDLGALKETTLGHADLVPFTPGMLKADLALIFAARIDEAVAQFAASREAWAEERFAQSQTMIARCSWRTRAAEWEVFLAQMIAARS